MSNDANRIDQTQDSAADENLATTSPIAVYSDLTPEQTHAAARVFIAQFATLDDPQARIYASLDPNGVTPSQLHEMHRYAEANHPEALAAALRHPDVSSATGDFAVGEQSRLEGGTSDQAQPDQN